MDIPLTKAQTELLEEFYSIPFSKVVVPKRERDQIWRRFRKNRATEDVIALVDVCPALVHEVQKAVDSGNNIQSAVFSECVYAQTLANHFDLDHFSATPESSGWLSQPIVALLGSYNLSARYLYKNDRGSRILIQAGGHAGVDGALISVSETNVFTIEFKEPGAKTSEPDLPPYGEDGNLIPDLEWRKKNPQFDLMLKEQETRELNFFKVAGSNVNDFSAESIKQAVNLNYAAKKFADVICTEDAAGFLAMIPSNQVHLWADLKGEIRPAGRNHYTVWTPKHLEQSILQIGGAIDRDVVSIPLNRLVPAKQRGGDRVSRYKISPLYFVSIADVHREGDSIEFALERVRQLRPTISAHIFFRGLTIEKVRNSYMKGQGT